MTARAVHRVLPLAGLLLIFVLTLVAAGCGETNARAITGSGKGGDPSNGKGVWAKGGCASCHALADTSGGTSVPYGILRGPNLDDAFGASRVDGLGDSEITAVAYQWIYKAQPPMPRPCSVTDVQYRTEMDQNGRDTGGGVNPCLDLSDQEIKDVAAYIGQVAGAGPAYTQDQQRVP